MEDLQNKKTSSITKAVLGLIKNPHVLLICLVAILGFCFVGQAHASSLVLSPSSGTFTVGSTFTVSLFLNTDNESVNTIGTTVSFPADKLQLVSPSAGTSIVSLWTVPPSVDKENGVITLQGGIPGGVNVNNGLITTLTFRVKSIGTAVVKFAGNSRVLLNDGQGTDSLKQTSSAIFELTLPPPAGPIVTSDTHPDPSVWYPNRTIVLRWASETDVDGYSYLLNDNPVDYPDDIPEGNQNFVIYKNVPDGIHYFHIKASKKNGWGGTTNFAVKIDATPPATFPITIAPGARSVRRQPIFQFSTTDAASGIDHYEVKLVPLSTESKDSSQASIQPLFVDATSPFIPSTELPLGDYDIIVRAYDKAGNYQEIAQRFSIVTSLFNIVGSDGIEIRQTLLVPWRWIWISISALLGLLLLLAWHVRRWHRKIHSLREGKELPSHIQSQLEELNKYRMKYGTLAIVLIIIGAHFLQPSPTHAQALPLSPPVITTTAQHISNEDLFYASGKCDAENATIIVYLQNLNTGETLSGETTSQKNGEWFYKQDGFLPSGNYLLWAQEKIGDEMSPPGPQQQFTVRSTAVILGSSRLSYETVYLLLLIASVLVMLGLMIYIALHTYQGRQKYHLLMKEIQDAEHSVRRGFAVLRRDIQAELATIKKLRMTQEISAEEKIREEQLLKDLDLVESYIGKEIWELEHTEAST